MSTPLGAPPIAGAIPFVDLSSHNEDDQHQIDWPTFAAFWLAIHPEAGAIVKMSQGSKRHNPYQNPYRHRQRWGAHAAGLKNVGLYHYVDVGDSGAANAEWLLATVGADGGIVANEFYALDWEDQSAGPTADLDAMALDAGGTIQRADGIEPMLYSGDWYAKPHNLERDPALAQFPLWWASYQSTVPPVPEPWASLGRGIACWQFTANAQLPGIPYAVDVSWWLAGLPALRAIQWGQQPDPLAGGLVAGTPDVAVNASGEATDINKAAQVIAAHVGQARLLLKGGQDADTLLATAQADAVAIALVSGLLS